MRGKRRDPRQDYAGVYYILNTKNSRIYVGQSVRIFDRQDTHRSQLTHGTHPNKAMLADWRAFGPDVFEFGVLVTLPGSTSRLHTHPWLQHHFRAQRQAGAHRCFDIWPNLLTPTSPAESDHPV